MNEAHVFHRARGATAADTALVAGLNNLKRMARRRFHRAACANPRYHQLKLRLTDRRSHGSIRNRVVWMREIDDATGFDSWERTTTFVTHVG